MPVKLPPLFWPAIAWISGCALAQSENIPWALVAALACAALLLLWRWRILSLWLLLAGIMWGSANLLHDLRLTQTEPELAGRELLLTGELLQLRIQGRMHRLRLHHVQVCEPSGHCHVIAGRVDAYAWPAHRQSWQEGNRLQMPVRLRLPDNRANPGGFDYLAYCHRHHIAWTASVRGAIQRLPGDAGLLASLRQRVRLALPTDAATAGVLQALLLADRSRLPIAVEDAFAATGAAHLLAISGLHIGMVAAWGAALCWWLLTRREAWMIALPIRQCAMTAGVLLATAYATLAGWPLPTQRAVLMLAGALLAWWWRHRYPPLNMLLLALMLIVLLEPASVLSVSLWLSFLATLGLLLIMARLRLPKASQWWLRWYYAGLGLLLVSAVATLATLPLIAGVFGRLPVWTLPANLLLVPLYGLWVLPLALLAALAALLLMPTLAQWLMHAAALGVNAGNHVLLALHQLPGGNLWLADPSLSSVLLYVAGMGLALWLGRRRDTAAAVGMAALTLCLWLILVIPERPPAQPRWMIWDVGQGAASGWLQADGQVLLVDAPGRRGSRFNGGTTVAAGLRAMGLTHADVICISHAQSDHGGGLLRLMAQLRDVRQLCLADVPANHHWPPMQQAVKRLKAQGGKVLWLAQGDHFMLGSNRVDVLWPPRGYTPSNTNLTSLVLSLRLPDGRRLLMPGDAEKPVEHALLSAGIAPHALMLVPHHGSRTSSSTAFLRALQPQLAVVQSGRNNRWHFPHPEIIARYRAQGSQIVNTANGALQFDWNGHGFRRHQYHPDSHRKYRQLLSFFRQLAW